MNTLIASHLIKLLDYSWKDEQRSFEEDYELEDSFDIKTHVFTHEQKDHIFYHIVQLQLFVSSVSEA